MTQSDLKVGISSLAETPAISASAVVEMLAILMGVPVAGISELTGQECVIGAIHDSVGLGLSAGDRLPRTQTACHAVVEEGRPLVLGGGNGQRLPGKMAASALTWYAGVPIAAPGEPPFGALWIADVAQRGEGRQEIATLLRVAPGLVDDLLAAHRRNLSLEEATQADLRATTQRLIALYEASADGILMVDSNLRIVVANRRFGEYFGLVPAECIGADDNAIREQVLGCLRDPETFQRRVGELYGRPDAISEEELELVKPKPRVLHRYSGPVRDREGRIMGRLWIFRDITSRKQLERELQEKANLIAEADRLKSEFLATTSHELRTPLNSLLGFIRLVLEDACTSREEERGLLSHAYSTGTHLVTLLNDILDLAKIEAGNLELEMNTIDVRQMLEEVIPISAVSAQAKGLYCTLTPLEPGLPAVRGDRDKLRQVLLNLIGNAIKYTHSGGIRVHAVNNVAEGRVCISIDDTGIGMDGATLAAVRSGHFTAKGGRGAGSLGITIARRFLALMGATLSFSSPGRGKGTTVLACLQPAGAETRQDAAASSGNTVRDHPAGLRVLVVEDDRSSSYAIKLALERQHGCLVTESEDVEQILGLVSDGQIDAVLMDVSLARSQYRGQPVDGLQITRLLKSDPSRRDVPVILMTAHAMVGDRERMLAESGADEYEAKPILDFGRLMRKMAQYIA